MSKWNSNKPTGRARRTTAGQISRRAALTGCVGAMLTGLAAPAQADPSILSAPDANDRLRTGDLILLDIRSRAEWDETGVAKGAWPVSMHETDFPRRLQAILDAYPPDRIGLICATGGRSAYIIEILKKNGITGIADLSEGMMGNRRGPGWIARGLPVVPLDDALQSYESARPGR